MSAGLPASAVKVTSVWLQSSDATITSKRNVRSPTTGCWNRLAPEVASATSEWRPELVAETNMVHAAIAELSDDFREALTAVDVAGLSYREAAHALRVREATITTRLFRARKQVAQRLRQGGQLHGKEVRPSSV